MLVFTDSRW